MNKQKLSVILEDYDYSCTDGCCTMYGTRVFVNGEKLQAENTDTQTIVRGILEHLGYDAQVEHRDETDEEL